MTGPPKPRKSFEEMVLFRQDPVQQLKKYIEESGQDFIDIFAHRNSKFVKKSEFKDIMKVCISFKILLWYVYFFRYCELTH